MACRLPAAGPGYYHDDSEDAAMVDILVRPTLAARPLPSTYGTDLDSQTKKDFEDFLHCRSIVFNITISNIHSGAFVDQLVP